VESSAQGKNVGVVPETPSDSKNLGNKAARLELALGSSDVDILSRLCEDKLPAVKAKVCENRSMRLESLLRLLVDDSPEVVESALKAIASRELTEQQNQTKQTESEEVQAEVLSDDVERSISFSTIQSSGDSASLQTSHVASFWQVNAPYAVDRA